PSGGERLVHGAAHTGQQLLALVAEQIEIGVGQQMSFERRPVDAAVEIGQLAQPLPSSSPTPRGLIAAANSYSPALSVPARPSSSTPATKIQGWAMTPLSP